MLQAFKWEVKQVSPLVRGLTGASYGGDVPRSAGVDAAAAAAAARGGGWAAAAAAADDDDRTVDQSMSASMTASETGEDKLPEPGTTRNLLAKFQSLEKTT